MKYFAFDLNIDSTFEIPFFKQSDGKSDIFMTYMNKPLQSYYSYKGHEGIDFRYNGKSGFMVSKEGLIVLFGESISSYTNMLLYIQNAFLIYFKMQSFIFFHGSSVKFKNNVCAIISGRGGIGKSTTAFYFKNNGCEVLSDDITIIDFDNDENPIIKPFSLYMNLYMDSISKVNPNFNDVFRISNEEKYTIPICQNKNLHSSKLKHIFFLKKWNGHYVKSEKINGFQKISEIKYNLQMLEVKEKSEMASLYSKLCQLSNRTEVSIISRPKEGMTIDEVAKKIERNLKLL